MTFVPLVPQGTTRTNSGTQKMEAAHFFETPKIILHGVGIQNAMTGLNTP
jgi:hypothetical protein